MLVATGLAELTGVVVAATLDAGVVVAAAPAAVAADVFVELVLVLLFLLVEEAATLEEEMLASHSSTSSGESKIDSMALRARRAVSSWLEMWAHSGLMCAPRAARRELRSLSEAGAGWRAEDGWGEGKAEVRASRAGMARKEVRMALVDEVMEKR